MEDLETRAASVLAWTVHPLHRNNHRTALNGSDTDTLCSDPANTAVRTARAPSTYTRAYPRTVSTAHIVTRGSTMIPNPAPVGHW